MRKCLVTLVLLAGTISCSEDPPGNMLTDTSAADSAGSETTDAVASDTADDGTTIDATDTSPPQWPWMEPCPLSTQQQDGVVATSAGWVRGEKAASGGWAYRGIPFAAPPVGPLRWAAPVPPACWTDVRTTQQFASECLQKDPKTGKTLGQEDCLFANVWTPNLTPPSALPVLVFIHGGGNIQGSAADQLASLKHIYSGHHLAADGAVVVTLQYRLGALGWLSLPAMDAAQGSPSGNYGLQDQQAALRWVQQNIGGFGGDPKRVLVFW